MSLVAFHEFYILVGGTFCVKERYGVNDITNIRTA